MDECKWDQLVENTSRISGPIENLWHELKEYQRRVVKPKTKQELINGIAAFGRTVDKEKCCKYIGHLKKVIP